MHGTTRIRDAIDFSRFSSQQVLPVTIYEFAQAGSDAPIVFIRHAESGRFQPVQLMGLVQGQNLMCRDQTWHGNYIPGVLRLDPLRLLETEPGSEQLAVAIEEESPLVSQTEGERVFDDDGSPSAFLESRREQLTKYFEHGQVTQAFVNRLTTLELLHRQELSVELRGKKTSIGGLYLVDEEKLRALPDQDLLHLARTGLLQAIYCHLMSQHQVRRLARLALEAGGDAA